MASFFCVELLPNGTVVHSYDKERHAALKAKRIEAANLAEQAKKIEHTAVKANRKWSSCVNRGIQTGETKSCLCSQRGQMIPVYWCNRHSVECIESPSSLDQKLKVCKRCEDGPWADLLR